MRLRGGGGIRSISVDLRIKAFDGPGAADDETSMAVRYCGALMLGVVM